MRTYSLLALLALTFAACTSERKEESIWVGTGRGALILEYSKDSLRFRQLFYDLADNYDYSIGPWNLNDEGLAGPTEEGEYFSVKDYTDSIELMAVDDSLNRVVFRAVSKYYQAKNEGVVRQMLVANTMTLKDTIVRNQYYRIEFEVENRLVSERFWLGDFSVWTLETYEEELFLVFDGFLGGVFHIKTVGQNNFITETYGDRGREFLWEANPPKVMFDQSLLIGDWVEDDKEKQVFFEGFWGTERTYEPDELFIDSNKIVLDNHFRLDTLYWQGNREGDLIRISEYGQFWTIQLLTETELIFSKIKRFGKIGTRKFVKK